MKHDAKRRGFEPECIGHDPDNEFQPVLRPHCLDRGLHVARGVCKGLGVAFGVCKVAAGPALELIWRIASVAGESQRCRQQPERSPWSKRCWPHEVRSWGVSDLSLRP